MPQQDADTSPGLSCAILSRLGGGPSDPVVRAGIGRQARSDTRRSESEIGQRTNQESGRMKVPDDQQQVV